MSEFIIEYLPDTTSIEREEIVRCRDCKHYCPSTVDEDGEGDPSWCKRWEYEWVRDDGFCAWGERRPTWRELENSDQYAAAAHTFDTTNHNTCFERGE